MNHDYEQNDQQGADIRPSKIASIEASHAIAIGQIPPALMAKMLGTTRLTLSV